MKYIAKLFIAFVFALFLAAQSPVQAQLYPNTPTNTPIETPEPTPLPFYCRAGCSASEYNCGLCSGGGIMCCPDPTSTPTPGECGAFASCTILNCPSGTVDIGSCEGGLGTCCQLISTPTPIPQQLCAQNSGCYPSNNGCGVNQVWVSYEQCNSTSSCNPGSGCTPYGGGCSTVDACGACHPTACSNTCGLGGCPGGCGTIDNCGGVSCGTDGCSGGVPSAVCGDNSCNGSENCGSCPGDCGECPPPPPPPAECPDGVCSATETCASCPSDCGACPVGTARVRAKIISNTATTCGDVAASVSYIDTNIGISPVTAPGYQVASGGTYVSWSVTPGTFTMTPITPSGYSLKIPCYNTGTGLTAAVGNGQTITWELGYTLGTPWFQATEGDVYAASGTLSSPVSSGASPRYFSLDGAGGTPGIITYGSDFDFDDSLISDGSTFASSENWLANEVNASTDYYAVMYHRFGSPTVADYPAGKILTSKVTDSLASRDTPYYVPGDLTINIPGWTVASGENFIFIVDGDLLINQRINISPGGFAAFIVNGNIRVASTVGTTFSSITPVVEGIYITSPSYGIYTGSSTSPGARRFVGNGTFVSGGIYPERDLDADSQNSNFAADLFLYNPELLVTMPDEMLDAPISWEEVAP